METIADLVKIARRCERAADAFKRDEVDSIIQRITGACEELDAVWSGVRSIYTEDFREKDPRQPYAVRNDIFKVPEGWKEYTKECVRTEVFRRANVDTGPITRAAETARSVFRESRESVVPTISAIIGDEAHQFLIDLLHEIEQLPSYCSGRNTGAAHWEVETALRCLISEGTQVRELARLIRRGIVYLRKAFSVEAPAVAEEREERIFIGHGRSADWKELKEFIQDRLHLEIEEFNRESPAGITGKERLEEMLNASSFAFLVMTAEDEHADGALHARENVIHEAGLFQGRLGFKNPRAPGDSFPPW